MYYMAYMLLCVYVILWLIFISSPRIRPGFVSLVTFLYAQRKITVVTATFMSTLNAVSWPIWVTTKPDHWWQKH